MQGHAARFVGEVTAANARLTNADVLRTYREAFDMSQAKSFSRDARPAYSMCNLYCGALGDTLCGLRNLFKSECGADSDGICRIMYQDVTGRRCWASIDDIPDDVRSVVLLVITPPCPDYSSSASNAGGMHGDKGGAEFMKIPTLIKKIRPMVVLVEEVGNLIWFEVEVVTVLLAIQDECGYVVHAGLVSMAQYGDVENSWRVPIVAWHDSLSLWARNYRIPVGDFIDAVSYTAADVATGDRGQPHHSSKTLRGR